MQVKWKMDKLREPGNRALLNSMMASISVGPDLRML